MLAVVAALPALASTGAVGAQGPPTSVPGGRVLLLAADGDTNTYVPAPVRAGGVDGAPPPPVSTIQVTFAPGFPTAAQAPVNAAMAVWSQLITSSQPITVRATYTNLGAGTLGGAGPTFVYRDFTNAPVPGTFYAQPLAEALAGTNLGGSDPDVEIDINVRSDWYFGTDGNPPAGRFDLMSVVMHEFLHGLGFLGTMDVNASNQGYWGIGTPTSPDIYDRFTQNQQGTSLLNTTTFPNPSAALRNALQSGALFFNSPRTNRGLSDRPRLYSPPSWSLGSSYAHLDEFTYPAGSANSLATPFLNTAEAVHAPGPIALCMLEAMGWQTVQDCTPPATTQVVGFTWFATGGFTASGPSGTTVRAYATGASTNRPYKLVSGLDGGPDRPCMWDTVPLNPTNRFPNSTGFIPNTSGPINRGPGNWQVCFREENPAAGTLRVSIPATFRVTG